MIGKPDRMRVKVAVYAGSIRCNRSTGLHDIYSDFATPRHGNECPRGVPEIQEVLSINQAPTSYRQIDDSQKTEGISRITQLCARGIRIAFMSTGEIFTDASGMNINPVAMGMVSETDIRTSVYCHMAIV